MKEIRLTQGKVALVDDKDYEWLSQWKWCYSNGYASRKATILMHRVIMNAIKGQWIDHINGNGLDNTRANLRFCNQSQNLANRGQTIKNKSGFKGVYKGSLSTWRADIKVNGKTVHLGFFESPEGAACAYDEAARQYFGEFAKTNF